MYCGKPLNLETGLDGAGLKQERDGTLYAGEWSAGLREGFGSAIDADGRVWTGLWKDDQLTGSCVCVYPANSSYAVFHGTLKDGEFQEGTAFFANGRLYHGIFTEWRGTAFDGEGALRFQDGRIYAGRWKNGGTDIGGVIRRVDGRVNGKLTNTRPDYIAKAWNQESDRIFFYGQAADGDVRNGTGINFYADNRVFAGTLRGGAKNGIAVLQNSNGTIQAGEWKNDIFQGQGVWVQRAEGKIVLYIGGFSQGLFHGRGIRLIYQNNAWNLSYYGDWAAGQRTGIGLCVFGERQIYFGGFQNDLRHGPGEIIAEDGSRIVSQWKEGEPAQTAALEVKSSSQKKERQTIPPRTPDKPAQAAALETEASGPEKEEQRNAVELYTLGKQAELEKRFKDAFNYFQQAAAQGHLNSILKVAYSYYRGIGVEANHTKAVEFYQKAAKGGNSKALCSLGACHIQGHGVPKSYEKAAGYFQKAADMGDTIACHYLAWCYEYGRGVSKNLEKAVEFYRKAANDGYAAAQYKLARCYETGQGIPQSWEEAVNWYRVSAKHGYVLARYHLAWCYRHRKGIPMDQAKAAEFYREAAELGYVYAQCGLGVCYYKGKGVEKNYTEAVKWLSKAVEKGNARANYLMGSCYEYGRGVTVNLETARRYYEISAQKNHRHAKEALRRLQNSMKG